MNVIIFGATSGIGKELAKLFVDNGHKVAITGRRLDKLKEIHQTKPKSYITKQHDVRELASSDAIFEELVTTLSTIDIIVYSSGIGALNRELSWKKELPTLETNILGAAKILGLSYHFFKKQGYGHIVGISSIAGIRGNAHAPAYASSKSFLSTYLESLWIKGKKSQSNIVVTDIIPGFVDTDMAQGAAFWMASAEKAAKQIFTAIKKKKRRAYITKRWRIIALLLKIIPARVLLKT